MNSIWPARWSTTWRSMRPATRACGSTGRPAAVIVFVLTWIALQSFRYAVVVFLLSLFCVGLAFASVGFWGDRMNPVLIVMPLLVLTLGVAGGIHLVNYLVEEYRRGRGRGAAVRAIKTRLAALQPLGRHHGRWGCCHWWSASSSRSGCSDFMPPSACSARSW